MDTKDIVNYTKTLLTNPNELQKYNQLLTKTNNFMKAKLEKLKQQRDAEELTDAEKKQIEKEVLKELSDEEKNNK